MRKLLFAALAALVLVCPRASVAQNYYYPALTFSPVTINAQCSTPATGCAAGQFASVSVGGRNSVSVQVVTSNFTGTLSPYLSTDGGNTWVATRWRTSIITPGIATASSALAASTTTFNYSIFIPFGGVTDVMVASTAAVTNTATLQLTATNTLGILQLLAQESATKGSQPVDSFALPTQDLKDSGRSFVAIDIDAYTLTASDAVMTFQTNKAGTVTGSLTTYAITSAKILRLQELHCTLKQTTATAASAIVRLRLNTGGACVVGSGLVQSFQIVAPTGTSAAELGVDAMEVTFPDGMEFTGASWNICISAIGSSANGTLVCGITAYEY